MSRKSFMVFVLAAGVVASALVYDGISRRNSANSQQLVALDPVSPTTPAAQPGNASSADTEVQLAGITDATTPDVEPGQDVVNDTQDQMDDAADAGEPAAEADAEPAQPIIVPAGTTLTVRLGEDLGSRVSHANQRFSATLDRDVIVGGQTVIAAGASVTGRVVSAKPAGPVAGEANLQIKVTSVSVNDARLPVVTSTRIFGPKIKGKNKVGRFMKGLAKRAAGQEREVLLAEQSTYSFTLRQRLLIQ